MISRNSKYPLADEKILSQVRTCQLEITKATVSAAHRLSVRQCGLDFFPQGILGSPNKNDSEGRKITLEICGLNQHIKTDMPTYANGKPRWFFRDRSWVAPFMRLHNLEEGDKINITRVTPMEYEISPVPKQLTFIDLFAGIGGTRTAFESADAKCVFSSEWNKYAQDTYEVNYNERPHGDITAIDEHSIPDHDILVAGFPCQPFSIAGVSKKNALGKAHGFADETQGTLFFDIERILKAKRPKAFLLENVKNLKSHDKGRTFAVILRHLTALGYKVEQKIIDGSAAVPQHRKRIYIVGTRPGLDFEFPGPETLRRYHQATTLGEILDDDVPEKYTLTRHLWSYLKKYKEKHRLAGNGFGYGLVGPEDITRTLSARYYKDGSEILYHEKGANILLEKPQTTRPRRLTPRECARLMGFDGPGECNFKIEVSDSQAYKQFGNSVVVPVVKAIAEKLTTCIRENRLKEPERVLLEVV